MYRDVCTSSVHVHVLVGKVIMKEYYYSLYSALSIYMLDAGLLVSCVIGCMHLVTCACSGAGGGEITFNHRLQ